MAHERNLHLTHPINDQVPFCDLPTTVRETWWTYSQTWERKEPEAWLRCQRFGYGVIPMATACRTVLGELSIPQPSFQAYHKRYMGNDNLHRAGPRDTRWPCVLSEQHWELFEDGWHRFHAYYAAGDLVVPVTWMDIPYRIPLK